MRRLTLILSDLYLPEEAVADAVVPEPLTLPGLSWLLRFADEAAELPDWRGWLLAELGLQEPCGTSIAAIAARAWLSGDDAARAWLATPVHLAARLDHVRLVDRGLLRVPAEEQAAWAAEFARQFGPELRLHPGNERGFILLGPDVQVATRDPARLLDADVAPALPPGPEGLKLRRLAAEIEMWLHTAALNEARERARLPRITALWLWGGGTPPTPLRSVVHSSSRPSREFFGGDPFLAGVANALSASCSAPPAGLAALGSGADHAVVELAPMTGGADESLASLEATWFAPARAALNAGEWAVIEVIANDRRFRISGRAGFRFWRARRDWLRNLARRGEAGQA